MKMRFKMNQYTLALVLFLGINASGFCQELLTIENAVQMALENNYAIKIAGNEAQIDATNVSLANA
jgi:outer membrane protein